MHLVAESYRNIILNQHDAVKNPAAHIARTLEGIKPATNNGDRVVALLQPACQIFRSRITQQGFRNPGRGHKGCLHLNKGGLRRLIQRALCRAGVFHSGKGGVDLADIQRQPAQGAVALHRHPILWRGRVGVNFKLRAGGGGGNRKPAQPQRARDLEPRAHDGIVDHHDRNSRARNNIQLMPAATRTCLCHQIKPAILGNQRLDFAVRNADQNDWLGVFDQLHPDHLRRIIHRDHGVNGLAGIPRGGNEIRRDKSPTNGLARFQDRGDGNICADGAKTVGAFNHITRDNCGQQLLKYRSGGGGGRQHKKRKQANEKGRNETVTCHAAMSL